MPESILNIRKVVTPEFIFGVGAINLVGQYAINLASRKTMIVTDNGVISAGWVKYVTDSLQENNIPYVIYSDISPNPSEKEVMLGAQLYQEENCNSLIAIGGGSPIDCAKGIGIVSSNQGNVLDFEGVDNIQYPIPPLICLPTTAGSSADVSQFTIINDQNRKVKIAIVSKAVVPDIALIDPTTLTTMDNHLTACTGMDALTHAIEAYVSNASSSITDLYALEAVRLITNNLLKTIVKPDDLELRGRMMLGSLYAGLAFSNAILGAVHAMAHSLGGYLDLPHGECNAILLSHVIDYNYQACPEKYCKIGEAMGLNLGGYSLLDKKNLLIDKINQLNKSVGVNKNLSQLGVTRTDIPLLASNALNDACLTTNPRDASQRDLEVIYEQAL
ncbi:MAG: iron-containing alcohol dehydrogenase [Firmicutes bacterium]|nr:iron-containing alcohol dehydrogenase [Bacillota bacterium]